MWVLYGLYGLDWDLLHQMLLMVWVQKAWVQDDLGLEDFEFRGFSLQGFGAFRV